VAEVVKVARFGPDALNLVFRVNGRVEERLVYRGEKGAFEQIEAGRSYAFDADGGLLRLASEAYRIRLAYLFDPYLAVSGFMGWSQPPAPRNSGPISKNWLMPNWPTEEPEE